MKATGLLEVLLVLLAFAPLGASTLYVRIHGGATPPFEVNVVLFAAFAVAAAIILLAERRGLLKA